MNIYDLWAIMAKWEDRIFLWINISQRATMGETGLIIIAIIVFQALATASEEWGVNFNDPRSTLDTNGDACINCNATRLDNMIAPAI